MVTDTEADILQRILDVDSTESLSAEAARYILSLGFRDDDLRRMEELSTKSNEGELNPDERLELARFDRVRLLLVRLKSRARHTLRA